MIIKELKEVLSEYPEDNFVHIRIWIDNKYCIDTVVDKTQQGVDGSILITGTIKESILKPVRFEEIE